MMLARLGPSVIASGALVPAMNGWDHPSANVMGQAHEDQTKGVAAVLGATTRSERVRLEGGWSGSRSLAPKRAPSPSNVSQNNESHAEVASAAASTSQGDSAGRRTLRRPLRRR